MQARKNDANSLFDLNTCIHKWGGGNADSDPEHCSLLCVLSVASWLKSSNIFELCMEAAVVLQSEGKADMYWHAQSRLSSTE